MAAISPVDIPLLSANQNPTLASAQGGGDLVVQDSALLSSGIVSENNVASAGSSEIRVYTVREGDSLSRVAEMFGVTTKCVH